jgi:Spy/CpxP family protein refolding chaperone
MKTQTFVTHMAVISSLLIGAALHAVAQPGPGGPAGPGPLTRFELTRDQQTKVREARQASENERTQLTQKLAAAQKEAVAAALTENPDEKTVRAKLEAVTKLQTDIGMLNFKNYREVKFTDEQKEQMTSRPLVGYSLLFGVMGPGGMGAGMMRGGMMGGGGGGGVNK